MKFTINKKITIFLAGAAALVVVLFLLRGVFVRLYVSHKIDKIEQAYNLDINYTSLKVVGIAGARVENFYVKPIDGDTLIRIKDIKVKLSFFKLLLLRPDITNLKADNIEVNFIKRDSVSNFDFLYKSSPKKQSDTTSTSLFNFKKTSERMFSLLLEIIPSKADIKNVRVKYENNGYLLTLDMPQFEVKNGGFETKLFTSEQGLKETLVAKGVLDESDEVISADIFGGDTSRFVMPFLEYRWGAKVMFDTLSFSIKNNGTEDDRLVVTGSAKAKGFSVLHQRVSPEEVSLNRGELQFKFNIGDNYAELDSSSIAICNQFSFSPFLRIEKSKNWLVKASIHKDKFPSDELFSSLPKGLFNNLDGIKTSGQLKYDFNLEIDFSNVDSLKLESSLKPIGFKIINFGNTDLRRMNGEFEYTAYENGVPVRTFPVGPSYGNFRTLSQISPYLQMAVLQSEDGGFFYHDGFLLDAIRGALATDIKEKRFRRGGSTISMQLVKNVYLSRHKTLARKFEEILIVWLIENNRLSSKERMFEVYMNIIEWGPGVYGAAEAARFYFDKDVRDINANEAIFLASIIPSPKRALNSFDSEYKLKPSLEGYYRLLAGRLKIKGLISEEEEMAIKPEVKLGEAAKKLIDSRNIPETF